MPSLGVQGGRSQDDGGVDQAHGTGLKRKRSASPTQGDDAPRRQAPYDRRRTGYSTVAAYSRRTRFSDPFNHLERRKHLSEASSRHPSVSTAVEYTNQTSQPTPAADRIEKLVNGLLDFPLKPADVDAYLWHDLSVAEARRIYISWQVLTAHLSAKLFNDNTRAGEKRQNASTNRSNARVGAIGRTAVFEPLGDLSLEITDPARIFSAKGAGIVKNRLFVVIDLDEDDMKDGMYVAYSYGFQKRGRPTELDARKYMRFVQEQDHGIQTVAKSQSFTSSILQQSERAKAIAVKGPLNIFTKPSYFKVTKGDWISWEQDIEWVGHVVSSNLGILAGKVEKGRGHALAEAHGRYLESLRAVSTAELAVQALPPATPESLPGGSPA